jgi:hypothetical protein
MSDKPISPAAAAHDRRHEGAPVQRRHPEGLRSQCEELCGLPRPIAGYGDEGGPPPLSAPYGAAADQPGVDQRRHRRAAVLLHRDARTAGPRSSPENRDRAAPGAGRAEARWRASSKPRRATLPILLQNASSFPHQREYLTAFATVSAHSRRPLRVIRTMEALQSRSLALVSLPRNVTRGVFTELRP